MTDGRIIICGTGRAGTSFLVRLLTRLGYDTGYTADADGFNPAIRAGCELIGDVDVRDPQLWARLPQVVKSPFLSTKLDQIPVPIGHVLIPVRDLDDASASRDQTGLQWAGRGMRQRDWLACNLGEAVATCMTRGIPFTLLQFPRLVQDAEYCLRALRGAFPFIADERDAYEIHRSLQT